MEKALLLRSSLHGKVKKAAYLSNCISFIKIYKCVSVYHSILILGRRYKSNRKNGVFKDSFLGARDNIGDN